MNARWLVGAALVLGVIAFVVWRLLPVQNTGELTVKSDVVQRIEGQSRDVETVPFGETRPLYENDGVRVDDSGRALLDLSGCIVEIFRNSRLEIKPVPKDSAPVCIVEFEHGTIYSRVQRTMVVETEWAVLTSVSTEFLVHQDPAVDRLWLIVVEGAVRLEAAGDSVVVTAGQLSFVDRGQPPQPPGPANREGIGDLLPPLEELTNGQMSDAEVLIAPPPAAVGLDGPMDLEVYLPTGNVWVANLLGDFLAEVSGKDPDLVLSRIDGLVEPDRIVIWQSQGLAIVGSFASGTVTIVDLERRTIVEVLEVSTRPTALDVNEETGEVVVGHAALRELTYLQLAADGSVIGMRPLPWPSSASSLAYDPVSELWWVGGLDGLIRGMIQGDWVGEFEVPGPVNDLSLASFGSGGYAASDAVYAWGEAGDAALKLDRSVLVVEDFGDCLGAMTPGGDLLFVLPYSLEGVLDRYPTGIHGAMEGRGLAYNPEANVAYVADFGSDTVTAIAGPCP